MASKPESPKAFHKMYAAYKKVVAAIAEALSPDDVNTIRYVQDLTSESTSALDTLKCLEREGKFSCHNIEPLKEILTSVKRCDLITKHIDEYKRQYSGAGGTAMQATSGPCQTGPQRPESPRKQWSIACSPTASPTAHYPSLESHSINEGEHPHFQASISSRKWSSSGSLCVFTTPMTGPKMFATGDQPQPSDHQDPDTISQHSNRSEFVVGLLDNTGPAPSPPVAAEHGYLAPQVHRPSTIVLTEPQHGTSPSSTSQRSSDCSSETLRSQASPAQLLATVVEPLHQEEGAGARDMERSWCLVDKSEGIPAGLCSGSWQVKRSAVCTIICTCNPREEKFIKLGKLTVQLNNSKAYLRFVLRLYPCGKDDDVGEHFVTLGVEIQVPSKYKDELHLMRIKMSCKVECPGAIDTEVRHAESEVQVNGQCFNVHALVPDMAIVRSRSSHLTVHVTAEVLPVQTTVDSHSRQRISQ